MIVAEGLIRTLNPLLEMAYYGSAQGKGNERAEAGLP